MELVGPLVALAVLLALVLVVGILDAAEALTQLAHRRRQRRAGRALALVTPCPTCHARPHRATCPRLGTTGQDGPPYPDWPWEPLPLQGPHRTMGPTL